jgi:hypothetical protein
MTADNSSIFQGAKVMGSLYEMGMDRRGHQRNTDGVRGELRDPGERRMIKDGPGLAGPSCWFLPASGGYSEDRLRTDSAFV